jgi:hypothetical protein
MTAHLHVSENTSTSRAQYHLQLPQRVHPPLSLPLAAPELQHLLVAPVSARLCVGSSSGRSTGKLQGLLEL